MIECKNKVINRRKVAGAIKLLVNEKRLSLVCVYERVLKRRRSKTMMWK